MFYVDARCFRFAGRTPPPGSVTATPIMRSYLLPGSFTLERVCRQMQQFRRFLAVAILVLVCGFTHGQLFADQTLPEGLLIQGYAGRLSYAPGEEVTLHLNSFGGSAR
ncbi:MAG: hypothetical protein R3C18_18125 [Planctomycetaceae bacterium]